MTFIKNLSTIVITLFITLGLAACSDGTAEDAGQKVDKIVNDAGNAIEDAGDKADSMMKDASNAIEDAGDKADSMMKDAGNAIEDACEKVKDSIKAKDKDC